MNQNHSLEKEKYVIGAIFHRPELLHRISSQLSEQDFYLVSHQKIYALMLERLRAGLPISLIDFGDFSVEVVSAYNIVVLPESALHYIKDLRELSRLRRIHTSATEIKQKIEDGTDIQSALENFQSCLVEKVADGKNAKQLIEAYEAEQIAISERIESGIPLIGLDTGFTRLNRSIDGLRPGHFWVIGGYTSTGKTYFSLNIVKKLLIEQKRVLFYSLEMSTEEIASRLVGLFSGINTIAAMKGALTPENAEKVVSAKNDLFYTKLKVFDTKRSLDEIRYSILGESVDEPVDCVVIDYLQLLEGKSNESQYETLRRASSDIQAIAKSTKIPIIALSQINNDSARNESEVMGFKGAGDIAASADMAVEIRLNETSIEEVRRKQGSSEPINMKVIIKKNRHGSKGEMHALFKSWCGEFQELNP